MPVRSPYEVALGDGLYELHPSLRRYFSALPDGCVGIGEGVFAEVGTPRRWLHRLLRPLERRGVLYAGHARSVRFRVVNRTVAAQGGSGGAGDGGGAEGDDAGLAVARRELDLPGGVWTMADSVSFAAASGRVVDRIGCPTTAVASFDVEVRDGGLLLTSRRIGLMLGRLRVRVPRPFAPVVRLGERRDPVSGLQRVELTIDAPLVGRIYGYRGHFAYGVVRDAGESSADARGHEAGTRGADGGTEQTEELDDDG